MGEANINNNHNSNTNNDNFIRKEAISGGYVDGFSSNRASWRSRKNPGLFSLYFFFFFSSFVRVDYINVFLI